MGFCSLLSSATMRSFFELSASTRVMKSKSPVRRVRRHAGEAAAEELVAREVDVDSRELLREVGRELALADDALAALGDLGLHVVDACPWPSRDRPPGRGRRGSSWCGRRPAATLLPRPTRCRRATTAKSTPTRGPACARCCAPAGPRPRRPRCAAPGGGMRGRRPAAGTAERLPRAGCPRRARCPRTAPPSSGGPCPTAAGWTAAERRRRARARAAIGGGACGREGAAGGGAAAPRSSHALEARFQVDLRLLVVRHRARCETYVAGRCHVNATSVF